MVMFNCNRCSAGMKKKDVENHSLKCGGKSNINVTCIDCLKDFKGDAYESHTSCLTEEQRYNGKDAVVKPAGQKQNQWLGIVKEVLKQKDSLDIDVLKFLKSVQHSQNIPRNRKKFQNWARSAKHITDTQFLDKVFDILQAEFNKNRPTEKVDKKETSIEKPAEKEDADKSTEADNSTPKPKKSKKRKSSESGVVENGNGAIDGETAGNQNGETAENGCEAEKKLSKKERKLLKKKAKYELEVKEIENAVVEEPPAQEEVEPAKKTKKSKKRKLAEVDENVENIDDGKKRKVEEENTNAENSADTPLDDESGSPKKKKTKFNWHEIIVEVVKQSKNSEISLKKLSKKVINEYISRFGDIGIQEKLQSKFTKKVTHCPGIKVLKDRAKLVEQEE